MSLLSILGLEKEPLSPLASNQQPYSEEERLARKKRMEEMLAQQPVEEESFLDKIKGFLSPPVSVSGVGTNIQDLSYLSDKPQKPVEPMEPKPMQESSSGSWEQYGRPASNPYSEQMKQVFGDKAEEFERILRWGNPDNSGYMVNYGGENLSFKADGTSRPNEDGSVDRGLFQINSNTFSDLMKRKPERLAAYGIKSYDDMLDPIKNMAVAKIIYEEQGTGAWYGSEQYRKR